MPEAVGHGQDEDKRTTRAMLAAALLGMSHAAQNTNRC